jgi:hypothetical protein
MANITIDISTEPVSYLPGPEVKHGDTVVFTLGTANIASATVTFPDGTCLTTPGPYDLGGATMATTPLTVSATAHRGPYRFQVEIPSSPESRARHGHELERKNGGIDVTSDPPEEQARRLPPTPRP